MPLPRSFLYVPANREKFLDKALGLPADAFIFDLEDSVPASEKEHARAGVKTYAPKIADSRVWVRVNGLETGLAESDLDAVIGVKGIAGIFLPKVEKREEVLRWDAMIGPLEKTRGLTIGATRLVLSLESALGVLNAYDMSVAAPRVASLSFGGAQDGDLNTDLGCAWSSDGPEMMTARGLALLHARAARFDTPLDGVFADVRDPQGFEKDTALSRRLGYRGRKLIHPSQIEPCNRLYAPSERELGYYARVLEAFDKALEQGSASTTVDGKMIDVAMANAARRVLSEAAALKKAGTP
ncbi:MAG: citrate lyase subunit beta / citryl-CoA lyase [Alphaproteobacteria bacterium]|jgi:citrate lyase subunit beta/citryl-CoA lyase|nr:citrate lyase subunit beta / citryl-CoA lyase [Alphaproteobacteria bacterium]